MHPYPPQMMVAPRQGGGLAIPILLALAFFATLGFCFWLQAQIDNLKKQNAEMAERNEEVHAAAAQILATDTELKERTEKIIENYDTLRTRIDTLSIQVQATGQQLLNGSNNLTELTGELATLRDRLTNEVIRKWLATRGGEAGELERVLREAVGEDEEGSGAGDGDGGTPDPDDPDTTNQAMENEASAARGDIERSGTGD